MLTDLEQDRLETAARLLHERWHRLGSGHVCDKCWALARSVAAVLWGDPDVDKAPPPT